VRKAGPSGSLPFSPPRPFAPGFQAGSMNIQAGALSPFTLPMIRESGQQSLRAIELKTRRGSRGS
jgi:hypothetical protein